MGRGDIKTKKGKIFAGIFGNSIPAKAKPVVKSAAKSEGEAPAKKKAAAKKSK